MTTRAKEVAPRQLSEAFQAEILAALRDDQMPELLSAIAALIRPISDQTFRSGWDKDTPVPAAAKLMHDALFAKHGDETNRKVQYFISQAVCVFADAAQRLGGDRLYRDETREEHHARIDREEIQRLEQQLAWKRREKAGQL